MKFIRKPRLRKTVVAFFVINMLSSAFLPMYSYALTGSSHQIEYTSYEEPGATDMVNLLTGDFTYNLPLIDIPGPEGGFSLPLSYHAGVGVEQEASWVGLGWSMNAGAITRNINAYPDDANGEDHSVTVQDLDVIKGWTSNLGLVNMGWNNRKGHYGAVNFLNIVQVNWNEGISSAGLVGITVGGGDVNFNPVQFGLAVITILTWGAGAAASTGASVGNVAKSIAIDAAIAVASGVAMGSSTPTTSTSGYFKQTNVVDKRFFHRNYKIWLDHTRTESMFGALHLGKAGSSPYFAGTSANISMVNGGTAEEMHKFNQDDFYPKGNASDINYHIENGHYADSFNPALIAFDDYNVSAAGVSGPIAPYRLDVGSVSVPREMSENHVRLAPVRYQDYKVPFLYEGSPTNSYFHHVGGATSVTEPVPYFGLSQTSSSSGNGSLVYHLNDVTLKNERVRSDVNATKRIASANHVEWLSNEDIKNSEALPYGFVDFLSAEGGTESARYTFRSYYRLAGNTPFVYPSVTDNFSNTFKVPVGTYDNCKVADPVKVVVVFFANNEDFENGVGQLYEIDSTDLRIQSKSESGGNYYLEVNHPERFTALASTHQGYIVRNNFYYYKKPQLAKAIGGYVITGSDGTNYHFSLPVYDYDLRTEIVDVTNDLRRSIITRKAPFANTWLLTAITYSDYLDRNANGLVDEADWGGWVKLNYGKHAEEYKFRSPFPDNSYTNDFTKTKNYSSGSKQLYYLNSIETRSHVGLFLKESRLDGLSKNNVAPLRLNEIVILTKEYYTQLQGLGVPDYANKLNISCLSSSFSGTSVRDFINNNATKRVVFNYSYELCKGALNSINPTVNGKLSLRSISIKARGNSGNIIPDYKFEYGFNPNYDINKWDAWGYYSSDGTQTGTSHLPSLSDTDGAAWSLKKIITPLGAEMEVNYERDRYSSVSEYAVPSTFSTSTDLNLSDGIVNTFTPNVNFLEGDRVKVVVSESFMCPAEPGLSCENPQTGEPMQCPDGMVLIDLISGWGTVRGTQVILDNPITYTVGSSQCENGEGYSYAASVSVSKAERKGGGLRVGSLVAKDEFGIQNKIRYLYGKLDGTGSSGVIAKQNPYLGGATYNLDELPEYPDSPVLYGAVTVLNGQLSNDDDYSVKTVYEFETPNSALIAEQPTLLPSSTIKSGEYVRLASFVVENHTAKIGLIKSIKSYDATGAEKTSSLFDYSTSITNDTSPYQGVYSQGTLMFERINNDGKRHKAMRTIGLRYAYVLKSITSTKDGMTAKKENKKWDFITGKVLDKVEITPSGQRIRTVEVPAYTKYPAMGSKAINLTNKNMLNQIAATYSYRVDENNNNLGLIAAGVQTWSSSWNITTGMYQDVIEGGDAVWRKNGAYSWVGDYTRLRNDGTQTFSPSNEFNFAGGASNAGWQYLGATVRYDHFSMPLEDADKNNVRTVTKMGYNDRTPILSAVNASYNEVAFSSAEDLNSATGYFGAEVSLKGDGAGNAVVVRRSSGGTTHTGDCALSLSTGSGFVYKPTELQVNKSYRASVWTNTVEGRIYYKLNGGAEQVSAIPNINQQAGDWYQLNVSIDVGGTFNTLEVGVKSANGSTVAFDDFRFQPANASMNCYVYNPDDFVHTSADLTYSQYVLDNNNLYVRYQYNEKGQRYRTYMESLKYKGEKLVSESSSDYRRFHFNQ